MSTAVERSKRSILVGNIPGDTTEEQLMILLREFGSIVNFRFFNDSSGSQIGYAFCEYENQDMAIRAIHKLNDFQFRGQLLKVDTAASDKSKEELESFLQGGGNTERLVTEQSELESTTEKAPEEISKAVASLPPEQMFELMKQMKMCIENNPHEARNLLLQNPQLAYALLQAQVIMHIVDPEVAIKILDRPITVTPEVPTSEANTNPEATPSVSGAENNPPLFPAGFPMSNDQDMRTQFKDSDMRSLNNTEIGKHLFDPRFRSGIDPRMLQPPNMGVQDPRIMPGPEARGIPNFDPRAMLGSDPRRMPVPDPRGMPVSDPRGMPVPDPRGMPVPDPRTMSIPDPRGMSVSDPRGMPVTDPRGMPVTDPRGMPVTDPRGIPVTDPRGIPVTDPRGIPSSDPRGMMGADPRSLQNLDSRMDPRSTNSLDPRAMRTQDPRMSQLPDPRMMSMGGPDPRLMAGPNKMNLEGRTGPTMDPRGSSVTNPRMMPGTDPRVLSGGDPRLLPGDLRMGPVTDPRTGPVTDPRARPGSDPRFKPSSVEDPRKPPTSDSASAPASHLLAGARALVPPTSSVPTSIGAPPTRSSDILSGMSLGAMQQDQEKAALIMQVLQLSDDQIAMLPPEQRQSILMLKEQIARSHLT